MPQLLLATGNAGKAREFAEIFAGPLRGGLAQAGLIAGRWECVALKACRLEIAEPEEAGETFRANACLKAAYYARASGMFALADDSGLEVEALGGRPGVYSARWAQMHESGAGDAANNALLLRQMDGVADGERGAAFRCVLALARPDGTVLATAAGSVSGVILREGRGTGGFGYDALFYMPGLDKTTAELSAAEKHAVSHRGEACRRMRTVLEEVET